MVDTITPRDERPHAELLRTPETITELLELWEQHPYSGLESNEPYKVIEGDTSEAERAEIKRAFIAGEIENPAVSYPRLNGDELAKGESSLFRMLELSESVANDTLEGELLYESLARKAAEVYRHREIYRAQNLSGDNKEQALERAKRMTLEVFGEPDFDTFAFLLDEQIAKARACLLHDNPEVAQAATELIDLCGDISPTKHIERATIKEEALPILHEDLMQMFPEITDTVRRRIPEKGVKITHEEAILIFEEVFSAIGLEGWGVQLTAGNVFETSARSEEFHLGRGRAQFTQETAIEKSMHEGVGHAIRAKRGKESTKPLARASLPDHLDFEEGLATALEQIISGKTRSVGEQYYLACGLLLGLDQYGTERDFRGAYEVLWRRQVINTALSGGEVNVEKAKSAAYQIGMRVTRGGVIDTRDLAYYRGYELASGWLNDIAAKPQDERLRAWNYVLSAKHDPTNPHHEEYMEAA